MKGLFPLIIFLFINTEFLSAQEKLKVIRATSSSIKILDGDDLREGGLAPELRPDIYVYHRSNKPKKIVYYTNIDSISFNVTPGETYNFAVLLNSKDTCYQRVTSENSNKVNYSKSSKNKTSLNDTIPFVLGTNDAIHIKGRLNNSDTLDLIFDTGASIGVLSEEGDEKKATLNKDNKNKFEIAGITIENSPAMFINYHGTLKADGVLGYNAFEDKILEINYDKSIIVVHASMKDVSGSYSATDMIWRGSGLYIECILDTNNKKCKGLFLFDTGSKWSLSLTKDFATSNQLYGIMPKIGTRRAHGVSGESIKSDIVTLQRLIISNQSLTNVPIDLELPSGTAGLDKNILGNDILKRFNIILDYKNGLIYLQPNSLTNASYNTSFDENLIFIGATVLAGILLISIIIYRKRKAHYSASITANQ
jgi:hypothetical protein